MKHILLFAFVLLMGVHAQAAELADNVVAEFEVYVGFAPPAHRGRFVMQIMTNGKVINIDNKNESVEVATLAPVMMEKLAEAINKIKSDELEKPDSPPCMDAPSREIMVRQGAKSMVIWRNAGCRDYSPKDWSASKVAMVIESLHSAVGNLKYLSY